MSSSTNQRPCTPTTTSSSSSSTASSQVNNAPHLVPAVIAQQQQLDTDVVVDECVQQQQQQLSNVINNNNSVEAAANAGGHRALRMVDEAAANGIVSSPANQQPVQAHPVSPPSSLCANENRTSASQRLARWTNKMAACSQSAVMSDAASSSGSSSHYISTNNPANAASSSFLNDYAVGGPAGVRLRSISGPSSQYVKLNVGGSLHMTTIGTLTRYDSMLRAMFSGRMEVLTDSDGWVMIDRCGKHFSTILNFMRDGECVLPSCRQQLMQILAEAKYYCIQELIEQCQELVCRPDEDEPGICRVPIIQNPKQAAMLLKSTKQPVVKLLLNRNNNKYSYTHQSDDNLLKNLELFDKLVTRFNERILFVKDVCSANEVCSWTFYGLHKKVAEVCCTSIVYATDKKHTKVEFPEARIFEEAMNILLYEAQSGGICTSCRSDLVDGHVAVAPPTTVNNPVSVSGACGASGSANSSTLSSPTNEQDRLYTEKMEKARRELKAVNSEHKFN